jgi:predicted small lipoprotein YifL
MNSRTKRATILLAVLMLVSASMLAACGQKGPLYLPDDTKKEKQEQTAN